MEFNATFLATIITFIAFVILMNKILYAPILNIMEERKSFIDNNFKSASENDAKAQGLLSEKEEKLDAAKEEARESYCTTLDDYKTKKQCIIDRAQDSAKSDLSASAEELERISNDVKNGLKGSMTDLANDIVEKVIGYRSEIQGFNDDAVNKVLWEK